MSEKVIKGFWTTRDRLCGSLQNGQRVKAKGPSEGVMLEQTSLYNVCMNMSKGIRMSFLPHSKAWLKNMPFILAVSCDDLSNGDNNAHFCTTFTYEK